ncbi:hypothetical protein T10_3624 [Trichinella papuae]|uniref:Uncharacterized protein n=1 Tax=Trichinella papuae TaxID=268474 RepID=A0A0V1MF11_9BILA|nr:hypothetical protein T10_3624 [Trichinella papuae]
MARREWDVKALCDHMHQNVDALTALGKDPRASELTAADCLITLARELLLDPTKINWDEMTMENDSAQSDLSRFLHFLRNQSEPLDGNRRSSLLASGIKSSSASLTQRRVEEHTEQERAVKREGVEKMGIKRIFEPRHLRRKLPLRRRKQTGR